MYVFEFLICAIYDEKHFRFIEGKWPSLLQPTVL